MIVGGKKCQQARVSTPTIRQRVIVSLRVSITQVRGEY